MHIYLHIPFCKQACYYCDFHFSTSLSQKEAVVEAICQEIRLQKSYLKNTHISTIYFGGGTPSILDETSLEAIFSTLHQTFTILPDAEITLEANPDDINVEKLAIFKKFGINRLSIGIQSFHEPHLKQMNRAHNAQEAETCVKLAQDAGIDNITIDLIYAIPAPDHQILYSDLAKVEALNLQHVSAYCLTIEPQTVFGKWTNKAKCPILTMIFRHNNSVFWLKIFKEWAMNNMKYPILPEISSIQSIIPAIGNKRNIWALVRRHIVLMELVASIILPIIPNMFSKSAQELFLQR
jgi:putative oxygen-independent coproporphyrinogen III oxidase